jgi:hypothetical protein
MNETDDSTLDEMRHVALDNAIACEVSNQPERQLYWLRCATTETVVKLQPISNRRLDALSEWFLKHGFALTQRNWCDLKKKVNSDEPLADMTGDEKEHADEVMRIFREEDR